MPGDGPSPAEEGREGGGPAGREAGAPWPRASRQQRLCFLPLPHGHGSLRPVFAVVSAPAQGLAPGSTLGPSHCGAQRIPSTRSGIPPSGNTPDIPGEYSMTQEYSDPRINGAHTTRPTAADRSCHRQGPPGSQRLGGGSPLRRGESLRFSRGSGGIKACRAGRKKDGPN